LAKLKEKEENRIAEGEEEKMKRRMRMCEMEF
jgi:hypothetical protein